MKLKENFKKGISLIVLVITIIVLAILATTVIISISNSNIMEKARIATFKSDMQSLKEVYSNWVADYISQNLNYDITSINYASGNSEFLNDVMKGKVPDKYKEGLKVVDGKLVYETEDAEMASVVKALDMKEGAIDFTQYLIPAVLTLNNSVATLSQVGFDSCIYGKYDRDEERFCLAGYVNKLAENPIYLVDPSAYFTEKYYNGEILLTDSEMEAALVSMFKCDSFDDVLEFYSYADREELLSSVREDESNPSMTYSEALLNIIDEEYFFLECYPEAYFGKKVSNEFIKQFIVFVTGFNTFDEFLETDTAESFGINNDELSKGKANETYILSQTLTMFISMGFTNISCTLTNGVETSTSYIYFSKPKEGTGAKDFFMTLFNKLDGINSLTVTDSNGESYVSTNFNLTNCGFFQLEDTACELTSEMQHMGGTFKYRLVPEYGYIIDDASVSVIMNGVNVTSSVYNSSTDEINISNITGCIQITANAASNPTFTTAQIKDTNNTTVTLTPSNVQNYYGTKVSNYTTGNLTYRLFFVDFYGEFGDAGTIYLKADPKSSLKVGDSYSDKTSSTLKIDQMNPLWASVRGIATSITWSDAERKAAYLCDTSNWTTYLDDTKANFAIGSPSFEMFVASYNGVPHTNGVSKLNIIVYSKFGNKDVFYYWSDDEDMDSTGYNKMYYGQNTAESIGGYFLSSPRSININTTDILAFIDFENSYERYSNTRCVCPTISLKSTFVPELVAE